MAFKFQINNDVTFNHDTKLLKKSAQLTPKLTEKVVHPVMLTKVVPNKSKLDQVGMEKVADVSDLDQMKFQRDGKVVLDFGRHYVGKFKLNIRHVGSPQDAPLALRIKFAEVPAELTYESADYDGWLSKSWIQEEVFHIDQLPVELTLPRRYAFRYVELTVIDTSPKWSAVFSQPEVTAVSSADERTLTPIKLTDPDLQKIYDVSVDTLHDCMQEAFEDGPKRDRRLWLGDLRLQALANYATFGNNDLVKRCLYLFGGMTAQDGRIVANVFTSADPQPDDTFLLDYSLFFISTLYDYEQHTHDQTALTDLLPVAQKQMDYALQYIDQNGVFHEDEDYPVFVDWSNEFDKTTSGEAIIIYVLKQFMALLKETQQETQKYAAVLQKMVTYSLNELFDPAKNLFVSGDQAEVNVSSQVWMTLADVMPAKQAHDVMATAEKELFPIKGIATPYMYHHVAEALLKSGLKQDGIRLLKSYWGKMIDLGADTYWEAFEPENPDYSPYDNPIVSSYCHAWGCTPAYLIKKYLLN